MTGTVTDAQWRQGVAEELATVCGSIEIAHAVTAKWGSPQLSTLDDEVIAVLAQARRRLPVVVVTNATTRLEEDLRASGLLTAVDAVVSARQMSSRIAAGPGSGTSLVPYRPFAGQPPVWVA